MFELSGKYNTCKIFTDNTDNETISQLINLLNQPFAADSQIRIMPDTHAGAGCVIGTTMTITDKICPNLVGVDIGCGMYVCKLNLTEEILKDFPFFLECLDHTIKNYVPSGMAVNEYETYAAIQFADKLEQLYCRNHINISYALQSIGSLGGGNHFIELDKNKDNEYYLVVHSGSRHLGKEVACYYQKKAVEYAENSVNTKAALIEKYKAEGREKEIESALKALKPAPFQKDLAYCESELFRQYIHDMKIVQEFAALNRKVIVQEIRERWKGTDSTRPVFTELFTTVHNYIDTDNMILRKGAVSAQKDEKLIIPMNMRDGSLICIGKGNPDWNCSAPHGAGRIMSRGQAKSLVSMDEYKESMSGIYTTCVNPATIDESPMVYKPMQEIIDNIQDTVDIVDIIKPVYNYKAN